GRGAPRRLVAPPRAQAQARAQSAVWPPPRRIVCLRLTCQLPSGTADDVVQAVIDRVHATGPPPCIVVLDLRHTRAIDDDGRRALQTLHDVLAQGQSRLQLAHPAAEARATLTTGGPLGAISPEDVHGSLRQALLAAYASLPGPALVTSATRRFLTEPPEPLSPLPVEGLRRRGLLDAYDHGVGSGKRFGVGVAEAGAGHPGAAVGGGVVEACGGLDQHVQAHEQAEGAGGAVVVDDGVVDDERPAVGQRLVGLAEQVGLWM